MIRQRRRHQHRKTAYPPPHSSSSGGDRHTDLIHCNNPPDFVSKTFSSFLFWRQRQPVFFLRGKRAARIRPLLPGPPSAPPPCLSARRTMGRPWNRPPRPALSTLFPSRRLSVSVAVGRPCAGAPPLSPSRFAATIVLSSPSFSKHHPQALRAPCPLPWPPPPTLVLSEHCSPGRGLLSAAAAQTFARRRACAPLPFALSALLTLRHSLTVKRPALCAITTQTGDTLLLL